MTWRRTSGTSPDDSVSGSDAESGDECLRAALTVAAAGIDAAQADMRDNKLLLLLERCGGPSSARPQACCAPLTVADLCADDFGSKIYV